MELYETSNDVSFDTFGFPPSKVHSWKLILPVEVLKKLIWSPIYIDVSEESNNAVASHVSPISSPSESD